jgi:hypothetical protein
MHFRCFLNALPCPVIKAYGERIEIIIDSMQLLVQNSVNWDLRYYQ